jgi:hypothetical protein
MGTMEIPNKCEECGRRKPKVVITERGMDRSFNAHIYLKFICEECSRKDGATQ